MFEVILACTTRTKLSKPLKLKVQSRHSIYQALVMAFSLDEYTKFTFSFFPKIVRLIVFNSHETQITGHSVLKIGQ